MIELYNDNNDNLLLYMTHAISCEDESLYIQIKRRVVN